MYQDNVKNRQPITIKLEKGTYGYFNIAEKWNAMLADPNTSDWGEPLILALLERVDKASNKDDTLSIFNSEAWKDIVARTGPAESAWQAECQTCKFINIGFGTSGFVDEYYVIDYDAKVVRWKSSWAKDALQIDYSKCAKCGTLLSDQTIVTPFVAVKGYRVVRETAEKKEA